MALVEGEQDVKTKSQAVAALRELFTLITRDHLQTSPQFQTPSQQAEMPAFLSVVVALPSSGSTL